ncbi:Ubiquitin fusion degradation protein 4, partial [Linderina pennispora]
DAAAISHHHDYDEMDEDEDEDDGILSGNYPEDSDEHDGDDNDDDDDDDDRHSQGGDEDDDGREEDRDDDVASRFAEMLAGRQDIRRNLFGFDLGAISGMGNAQRFRPLVATLKRYDDPTEQLVALQEMAELLSISTEESLIGLNLGELCQVLVNLLKGADGDYGELTGFIPGNPDIMLLACRCLSNLLEALPYAGTILVRFGVVQVLCSKLMEIEYIDLAEQALSTLERISREFPANVCEAGGMSACLMFLDFFATSTQRTALSCAANCARGITSESFPQAREAMPVLERTVVFSDQKIAESSCVALLHLVSAFRSDSAKVEQLVSADLLKVVVD